MCTSFTKKLRKSSMNLVNISAPYHGNFVNYNIVNVFEQLVIHLVTFDTTKRFYIKEASTLRVEMQKTVNCLPINQCSCNPSAG